MRLKTKVKGKEARQEERKGEGDREKARTCLRYLCFR